jgi:hypothetical protein
MSETETSIIKNKWIIFLIFSLYSSLSFSKDCHLYKIVDFLKCENKICEVKLSNHKIITKTNPIIGELVEHCVEIKKIITQKAPITEQEVKSVIAPPAAAAETTVKDETPVIDNAIDEHSIIDSTPVPVTLPVVDLKKEESIKPSPKMSNCRKQRITGVSNCVNRKTCFAWLEDGNYIEHKYPVYIGDVAETCDFEP